MSKIKKLFHKTWIFVTAVAVIVGSSSAMVYALNTNIPEKTAANKASITAAAVNESIQTQASKAQITAEYTVIDRSKQKPNVEELKADISAKAGMTPEKVEEAYRTVLANMIPGPKDMSAEQAAAYAATMVKKLYGADLTGYTAVVSFSRNPMPNSDNWGVIFHAPKETDSSTRYSASVDSVNGKMLDASCYNLDFREKTNKNLQDPQWKNKAIEVVSKLLPANVSIRSSKVVFTHTHAGVSTVCELSDGSAFAVRIEGENKEAVNIQYFPNGYDGSWDFHPVTGNGVG
ncbi:hypothetical protein DCCM_2788 [Desulfocucumis palustris]|uniref:Uncharacterized protein n=1 Tax=Desulfocucumis palustris TaxID=1898651 RepID=A0A2L2XC56_9FIRM|nr:hypothetical protein [Desulfocucumis palustris]GBF33682.1 hypothetical protein DCCM_2788 [Desulfocucumis palustris]